MALRQQLSLALRPQVLDDLVGAAELVKWIRGHITSGRLPKAWMFTGGTGAGKTTVARILALGMQCRHEGVETGNACKKCRHRRASFDITEINASEISGVEGLTGAVSGAFYDPKPGSRMRVYILDEAQRISDAAQNLLLKYFEDTPPTTVFIVCTTEKRKILPTLRSRCVRYTMPGLELNGIQELVKRAISYAGKERPSAELVEALQENGVTSPRLVVQAVEHYLAGQPAARAARVDSDAAIDTGRICRAMVRGQWGDIAEELQNATTEDGRAIRGAACAYLKEMLVGEGEVGQRGAMIAEVIRDLSHVAGWDEGTQLAATVGGIYQATARFARAGRKDS